MRDIVYKGSFKNAEHEELGQISQNQNQFENYSITLLKILEPINTNSLTIQAGDIILIEDYISDSNEFLLEPEEVIEMERLGIETYLESCASSWAGNGEEDEPVEMCRWGLRDPEDYAYEGDDACNVLVKGCYNGYTPINRAMNEQGDVLEFANSAESQAWIDEQEEGTYYLSHNEAGRPSYTIVRA